MRWYAPLSLGAGLLFALTAPLAADDAKEAIKKERKRYEGTWQVVELVVDGKKSNEEDARKITVVNETDGKWTIESEGKVVARGTSEIDPGKKPKTVDLTVNEGDSKGKSLRGIYEFRGDTRKVCFAPPDQERPTEFSASGGSGRILAVLKRVKK